MTDREMLEMAAKAAGLVNHRYCKIWRCMAEYAPDENKFFGKSWNPRVDDGDALRLAVKLGIDVSYVKTPSGENVVMASQECEFSGWFEELLSTDPFEATRRAITRAAAQIGKSMP